MVIFLGIDEDRPVTLLEGNHRFIAALLAGGPQHLRKARMVAVFSPQMEKCCWYKTNLRTLARCLKNRIQHIGTETLIWPGCLRQLPPQATWALLPEIPAS